MLTCASPVPSSCKKNRTIEPSACPDRIALPDGLHKKKVEKVNNYYDLMHLF